MIPELSEAHLTIAPITIARSSIHSLMNARRAHAALLGLRPVA
jgi:hypothetical protein